MNERKEKAQDADTAENGEVAWVARPSLAERGFKKDGQGRAGCPLPGGVSLRNTSRAQAPGLPSQPETAESQLQKKKQKFSRLLILHARAHTHMRAVTCLLLQQPLER